MTISKAYQLEIMRISFGLFVFFLLAPLATLRAADTPVPLVKPDILWIVMDDVGAEFPCDGEKTIQTPHIDRLVREGTKFDRAFLTSSVCSPSRSAMITGMYQTSIAYELNTLAGNARKDALVKNSALMKQSAREGK